MDANPEWPLMKETDVFVGQLELVTNRDGNRFYKCVLCFFESEDRKNNNDLPNRLKNEFIN